MRVPCGSRREAHGEVRETPGTSRLLRREATGALVPRPPSAFTPDICGVNADAPGGVMWMRAVSVTFPALLLLAVSPRRRAVPVPSPRRDTVPAPAPPAKPPDPGVSEAASACPGRLRNARAPEPRPQRPGPSPVPRRSGPDPHPSPAATARTLTRPHSPVGRHAPSPGARLRPHQEARPRRHHPRKRRQRHPPAADRRRQPSARRPGARRASCGRSPAGSPCP